MNSIIDFDNYINGSWYDKMEIPSDKTDISTMNDVKNYNNDLIHKIIEDDKKNDGRIGLLFEKIMMRNEKDELKSKKSLCEILDRIDKLDLKDYFDNFLSMNIFFEVSIKKSLYDDFNDIYLFPMSFSMPHKDYYHKEKFSELKDKFKKYLEDLFSIVYPNYDSNKLNEISNSIVIIEEILSLVRKENGEIRDVSKNYEKMSLDDFYRKVCDNDDIDKDFIKYIYGKILGNISEKASKNIKNVIVVDMNYFYKLSVFLSLVKKDAIKNYFKYNIITKLGKYIREIDDLNFSFFKRDLLNQCNMADEKEKTLDIINILCGNIL